MPLEFEERDGILIVRPQHPEIGADQAEEMKKLFLEKINGNRWVAVDMRPVVFMDSSGLGLLVAALKATRGEGDLRLFGVQSRLKELFRLTRLDRVFAMDPDEETCLRILREMRDQRMTA
jgi:anti-sigma B factor antagonist